MRNLFFISIILFSLQSKAQTDEKATLRSIENALEAYSMGDFSNLQSEYIIDDNHIIGKKYLTIGYPYKNNEIILNKQNGVITSATYITNRENKNNVELLFQNGKVENVKIDLYSIDYRLKHSDDGLLIFSKDGSADVIFSLGFNGDATKTIVKAVRYSEVSKPAVSEITKMELSDNSFRRNYTSYKKNKEVSDKNILQKLIQSYSVKENNSYLKEYLDNGIVGDRSNGKTILYTYDSHNRLVNEIETSRDGKLSKSYVYADEKSLEFVKRVSVGDFPNEKYTYIDIKQDLPKPSGNSNDYEWKHGEYRIDGDGNLYFEGRDDKIRKKESGVWSDWKYADY